MNILIGIFTIILLLVSGFLMLVILAQKSADSGMGAAFGGGAAESAFGANTNSVLVKSTIVATVAFFVLSFGIYLCYIYQRKHHALPGGGSALPNIPAAAAPATPAGATSAPAVSVPVAPAPAAPKADGATKQP